MHAAAGTADAAGTQPDSAIGAIWDPCTTNRCLRPVTATHAALLRPATRPPHSGSRPWPQAWAQFWAHSSTYGTVHRWSPGSCSRGSRTVADAGERHATVLESVLGATPQEFESPILRHADLRRRARSCSRAALHPKPRVSFP